MPAMRVCYVCSFKEDSGGGVSQVVSNLSQYFASGHDVLVVEPGDSTRYYFDKGKNIHFLEVASVGKGLLYIPRFRLVDVMRIHKHLRSFSPQIIHLHDEGPIPMLLLSFVNHLSFRSILSFHMSPTRKVPVMDDLLTKLAFAFSRQNNICLSKVFGQMVDIFCAPAKCMESSICEINSEKKIVFINNQIDLLEFSGNKDIDKFSLISVGHIVPDKGCDYLIEVMRYLPQKYRLALVGETPNPRYLQKLENKIKEYGLNNVEFLGKVPHAEISGILSKSHLFVSASLLEVQSLAVLEALASGTPVVSLSNSTTDEFIDETVGRNFPRETPPLDFARKVEELCELDDKRYNLLSENARSKVSHLSLEAVGSKTLKVYEELVSQGKRKRKFTLSVMYIVLAVAFAKSVRILYFLERGFQKYESRSTRKS
jgi:glycosyltransferase involved in cell wall biosynthesis